jgi:hypothetical protein
MIPGHALAGFVECPPEVRGIDIANGQKTGVLVSEMTKTHPTCSDDPFSQLITRRQVAPAAKDMTRDNRKANSGCCTPEQKCTSVNFIIVHIVWEIPDR